MRKQTARIGLTVAVLPMTALAIHGLGHTTTAPTDEHLAAMVKLRVQAGGQPPTSHFHAPRHRRPHRNDPKAATWSATTAVTHLDAELAQASSQVISQGETLRSQRERYAAAAAAADSQQLRDETGHARVVSYSTSSNSAYQGSYSVPQSMAAVLACIRQYESGDNYSDSSNPYYRGAYQFSYATWASVGGTGDPAMASPQEQDMRAAMLAERDGWSPWSTASECGV